MQFTFSLGGQIGAESILNGSLHVRWKNAKVIQVVKFTFGIVDVKA